MTRLLGLPGGDVVAVGYLDNEVDADAAVRRLAGADGAVVWEWNAGGLGQNEAVWDAGLHPSGDVLLVGPDGGSGGTAWAARLTVVAVLCSGGSTSDHFHPSTAWSTRNGDMVIVDDDYGKPRDEDCRKHGRHAVAGPGGRQERRD